MTCEEFHRFIAQLSNLHYVTWREEQVCNWGSHYILTIAPGVDKTLWEQGLRDRGFAKWEDRNGTYWRIARTYNRKPWWRFWQRKPREHYPWLENE